MICKLILAHEHPDLGEWQADLARRLPVRHLVPAHVVAGEPHHAERPEGARGLRGGAVYLQTIEFVAKII